ncbi:hypothetical protein [Leifsonia sp. Root112D2]|uniref:hypothetical protein n=1 Tax=Leifsonia sp. Root112D2 TaxID=1736426 RepID=UPI000AE35CAC|nr:hypothetical protein [Leifsonia sp. Root112D2]
MKGKILFVTGAAIGYVLGARAGRKRYEQIVAAANKVWETPGVQKQVHQVQDFAAEKIGDIPDALIEGAKKAVSSVVKRSNTTSTTKPSTTKPSAQSANASKASTTGSTVAKKPAAKSTTRKPATKKPATKKPAAKKSAALTSASTRSSTAKSASATADETE